MAINKIVLNGDDGEQVLVDLTGDNVTADSLVVGHTAHGADGNPVEGTNPYEKTETDTEVQTQTDLIEQIKTALNGKAAGEGSVTEPVVQELTVTENGTYTAPDGVDGYSPVVVNVESSAGSAEIYYSALGQLYTPHMVIPAGNMRYVRDHFQGAVNLKSFIQQYGTPSTDSDFGLFSGCTALETVWVARATFGNYCFRGCSALKTVTLGRVGLAVTSISAAVWDYTVARVETITCYVNAETIADIPAAVSGRITPSASPNATIVYRNSTTGEVIAA